MPLKKIGCYQPIFCHIHHLTPAFDNQDFSIARRIEQDLMQLQDCEHRLQQVTNLANNGYHFAVGAFALSLIAGSIILLCTAFAVPATIAVLTTMVGAGVGVVASVVTERIGNFNLLINQTHQNKLWHCLVKDSDNAHHAISPRLS
jgi:uncharacterized membrane protein YgcG